MYEQLKNTLETMSDPVEGSMKKNHLKVTSKGDVEIRRMREILPIRDDFFLCEFNCMCLGAEAIEPMLFGDNKISIKFWKNREGHGKPTIVALTGLEWKTFNTDDNICVLVKKVGFHGSIQDITILITKKYH
tara:strand:+ start:60 stop:455 length:396 start_codon:yes stop_codon:yes gene_type:complete